MTATAIKKDLAKTAVAITAFAATLTVGLAAPPASHAVGGLTTSSYYCSNPATPWLAYSPIAGYKCFQYSNNTGLSSPASHV